MAKRSAGSVQIKLNKSDVRRFTNFLGNFTPEMIAASKRGVGKAAARGVERINKTIQGREFAANKASTIKRKGSDIPLIGKTGALAKSISFSVLGPFEAQVGVMKNTHTDNIAEILHNGATVTRGNSTYRIVPRPFIQRTFENQTYVDEIKLIWFKEMEKVIG